MANLRINNLAIRTALVDNSVPEGRYNTEDVSPMEMAYIRKHTPKKRVARADLSSGDVVAVLEGMYTSRRAVYIKRDEEYGAVLFCITEEGAPSFFKLDERYLFKLGVNVKLPGNLSLDTSSLRYSVIGEPEALEVEATGSEASASSAIMNAVSEVKFMRSYLSEEFKVDHSVEFYSQKY
ncbi:hypothetical protein PAEPH01_0594 [Pancytospora epiphaga]|nr:hypothetical protein PAEPH01_0594 [Pancytospora epiphaga]